MLGIVIARDGFSQPFFCAALTLSGIADDLGLIMKFLTNCAACAAPLTHHDIPTSCVACMDPRRSRDDVVEAVAILKSATQASKRTFGEAHPVFRLLKNRLLKARHERAFLDHRSSL